MDTRLSPAAISTRSSSSARIELLRAGGRLGLIVPLSAFSVTKFGPLQDFLTHATDELFVSSWSGDAHPAKLFEGANKRLQIVVARTRTSDSTDLRLFTSRYQKWYAAERPTLFELEPSFVKVDLDTPRFFQTSIPKIDSLLEVSILQKLLAWKNSVGASATRTGTHELFYTRKVSFFLQFLDFVPDVRDAEANHRDPSELKVLRFRTQDDRDLCLAALSSSLFYWYCYKGQGEITVPYFNFRPSKPTLDKIDRLLGPAYGLSDEEIQHVTRYDLKYRLGLGSSGSSD